MVLGTCALCLAKNVDLCDSHIFPEFLYKDVYDKEHHSFRLFSNIPDKPSKRQSKGIYEKLLCRACEGLLNTRYENYAYSAIFGGLRTTPVQLPELFLLENIDYAKFKLFTISLIWRAGVAQHSAFVGVSLGPHAERMRRMLLEDDPGEPYQYPCILFTMLNGTSAAILPPERVPKKMLQHTTYRALMTGMTWAFVVSSHMQNFPEPRMFLGYNNVLPIIKDKGMGLNILRQRVSETHY